MTYSFQWALKKAGNLYPRSNHTPLLMGAFQLNTFEILFCILLGTYSKPKILTFDIGCTILNNLVLINYIIGQ